MLIEAKGRSGSFDPLAHQKALSQVKTPNADLRALVGATPLLVAQQSHFTPSGPGVERWTCHLEDPPSSVGTSDLEDEQFATAVAVAEQAPIVAAMAELGRAGLATRHSGSVTATLYDLGLRIEIPRRVYEPIAKLLDTPVEKRSEGSLRDLQFLIDEDRDVLDGRQDGVFVGGGGIVFAPASRPDRRA